MPLFLGTTAINAARPFVIKKNNYIRAEESRPAAGVATLAGGSEKPLRYRTLMYARNVD